MWKENQNNNNYKIIDKDNISTTRKVKVIKKKKKKKVSNLKSSGDQLKVFNVDDENNPQYENKISIKENTKIDDAKPNEDLGKTGELLPSESDLKSVYINNWLICCFWCSRNKKNVNKVLFEEGSKILTERLDILNIFKQLYINGLIQEKLGIEAREMEMSDNCKKYLHLIHSKTDWYLVINISNKKIAFIFYKLKNY